MSDEIEYYCTAFDLIVPFQREHLKPAAYELSVGGRYSIDGENKVLRPGETLTIKPFEVVVIETLETVNMPSFLIGRWNIKTGLAYKGLLWVGGPQVDAGYRGFLSCPVYNLSDRRFSIKHGEEIAVLDFTTTTAPNELSKRYDWKKRRRVIFEDYEPQGLRSAIVTQVVDRVDKTQEGLQEIKNLVDRAGKDADENRKSVNEQVSAIRNRVDTLTTTTFTVIAVLFAALALALGKSLEPSFWTSAGLLAAIALWYALRSYMLARDSAQSVRVPLWFEVGTVVAVALFLLVGQYRSSVATARDVKDALDQSNRAKQTAEQCKASSSKSLEQLEKKMDAFRAEMEAIKNKKQ